MKDDRKLTLFGKLAEQADIFPDKSALISGSIHLTYSQLLQKVREVAGHLDAHGVGQGDRVCIARLDKTDFWIAVLACFSAKAVAVPVGEKVDNNFAVIANDCNAKCIIFSQAHDASPVLGENDSQILAVSIEEAKTSVALKRTLPYFSHGELAAIFYTSGTSTGRKKGVRITHDNFYATEKYMNEVMGVTDQIVEYVVAPINHAFGFGRLRAVLRAGGTIVLDSGIFNPAKALMAVKTFGCNAISSVSTGFVILLDKFAPFLKDIGSQINWIEIGSLPMPDEYKFKMLDMFPNATICMNYGLTEAMRSTLLNLRANPAKLKSVGTASPGVKIAILDGDGKTLPLGENGEICIQGVNVAAGYWGNENLWQDKLLAGWFRTGDFGYLDEEGFVYFLGRSDDIINVGGNKVCPLELEQRLAQKISDTSFCICGMSDPDGILHEVPVLCIEGSRNIISMEQIQQWLSDIEEYKWPRNLVCLEKFPRTNNGKIQRNKLKNILNGNAV